MSRFLLFGLIIFSSLFVQASDQCVPSSVSCDFYACKENQKSCGSQGYWQNFGYPYCQKFLEDQQFFSARSQVWLQDVRLCLQERVKDLALETSCHDLYKTAMHSHVSCYVDTGFCDLSYAEQFKVYWYLKGALRSGDTWKEAYLLKVACAQRDHAMGSSLDYGDLEVE